MQNDTKAVLGLGAAALAGSLYGQVQGIGRAAQAMNAQIDRDLHALGTTGHLPETKPVLPLTEQPRRKVLILLTSLLAGFLIVAMAWAHRRDKALERLGQRAPRPPAAHAAPASCSPSSWRR